MMNDEKKKMGRPALENPERALVALRLSPKQKAWVERESEAQGVTFSRIVKDLIDEAIEREERRSARLQK